MNFATCVSRIRLDPCPKFKARFLYTTWIRDALNEELATPPSPCISTEKGNATKVSTLSHVNNLSIIGLEGHRAGGKKKEMEDRPGGVPRSSAAGSGRREGCSR